MNTAFLILLVLLVGGCVIAFRIARHRQVHQRRVNPPERIWTEVQLPYGESESIEKFSGLASKLSTKTSGDKKLRQKGTGSIATVLAAWHEPGSNQPELHFYLVCDADQQKAIQASVKTSYPDAFLLPVVEDLRTELVKVWQAEHPYKTFSESFSEFQDKRASRKSGALVSQPESGQLSPG